MFNLIVVCRLICVHQFTLWRAIVYPYNCELSTTFMMPCRSVCRSHDRQMLTIVLIWLFFEQFTKFVELKRLSTFADLEYFSSSAAIKIKSINLSQRTQTICLTIGHFWSTTLYHSLHHQKHTMEYKVKWHE